MAEPAGVVAKRPAMAEPAGVVQRERAQVAGFREFQAVDKMICEAMWKKLSTEHVNSMMESASKNKFVFSSGCSGSGIPEIAWSWLMRKLNTESILAFSCEMVKFKQDFLTGVVHPRFLAHPGCMFSELGDLKVGVSPCTMHNGECEVLKNCSIFVCGFSCKDCTSLLLAMVTNAQVILQGNAFAPLLVRRRRGRRPATYD